MRRKESLFAICMLLEILGGSHAGYIPEISQCGGLTTETYIEEYLLEVTARRSINNLNKFRHTPAINIVGITVIAVLLNIELYPEIKLRPKKFNFGLWEYNIMTSSSRNRQSH